jgi:hypothetical protein
MMSPTLKPTLIKFNWLLYRQLGLDPQRFPYSLRGLFISCSTERDN